jgi:hypothetical protein
MEKTKPFTMKFKKKKECGLQQKVWTESERLKNSLLEAVRYFLGPNFSFVVCCCCCSLIVNGNPLLYFGSESIQKKATGPSICRWAPLGTTQISSFNVSDLPISLNAQSVITGGEKRSKDEKENTPTHKKEDRGEREIRKGGKTKPKRGTVTLRKKNLPDDPGSNDQVKSGMGEGKNERSQRDELTA